MVVARGWENGGYAGKFLKKLHQKGSTANLKTEDGITEFQDKTTDIIQSEDQKEKRMKKNEQPLQDLWNTGKQINICIMAEKVLATHSSTLAWKVPWTEETGRLQSMGSVRVRHD